MSRHSLAFFIIVTPLENSSLHRVHKNRLLLRSTPSTDFFLFALDFKFPISLLDGIFGENI